MFAVKTHRLSIGCTVVGCGAVPLEDCLSFFHLFLAASPAFVAFCVVVARYLLPASRLGRPSLSDESTALSSLTFFTYFLFLHFSFFGLPCVFYTCAIEPLRVWARFFCLPLLPLSRLRAQGNRQWPKMTCELMLRWRLWCRQKKQQKKWTFLFHVAVSNLCILESVWKTHLCFNRNVLPHTGAQYTLF